jgi:hypothetical protein
MYLIRYKTTMQLHYLFLQNAPISNFCVINYTFSYILPDQETFFYTLYVLGCCAKKPIKCMNYQKKPCKNVTWLSEMCIRI